MAPPRHKLTDVEGAFLDELATLVRDDVQDVPTKDLHLRLEARGFTEAQTRRALMSLLRRGQIALAGAKRVTRPTNLR